MHKEKGLNSGLKDKDGMVVRGVGEVAQACA
jgi:hypothetical protein